MLRRLDPAVNPTVSRLPVHRSREIPFDVEPCRIHPTYLLAPSPYPSCPQKGGGASALNHEPSGLISGDAIE